MGLTGYSVCNSICRYIQKPQNGQSESAGTRPCEPQYVFGFLIPFFQSFAIGCMIL